MKNDYSLIEEYLESNYEISYNKNKSKYDLITNLLITIFIRFNLHGNSSFSIEFQILFFKI